MRTAPASAIELGDAMEKVLILCRVSAANGIGFVMNVPGGVMGVQNQAIGLHPSEMKDTGFVMIDPNDRVVMTAHRVLQSRILAGR